MNLRLLVVDDHEDIRSMVALALRALPIDIVGEAVDGADAIEKARALRPDVILMDIVMPQVNGVEATRTIRKELPETTIIGFTGSDPEAAEEMLRAGAIAVFQKTSFVEVIDRLQELGE